MLLLSIFTPESDNFVQLVGHNISQPQKHFTRPVTPPPPPPPHHHLCLQLCSIMPPPPHPLRPPAIIYLFPSSHPALCAFLFSCRSPTIQPSLSYAVCYPSQPLIPPPPIPVPCSCETMSCNNTELNLRVKAVFPLQRTRIHTNTHMYFCWDVSVCFSTCFASTE